MRTPIKLHAHTHRPGGSDPLPGISAQTAAVGFYYVWPVGGGSPKSALGSGSSDILFYYEWPGGDAGVDMLDLTTISDNSPTAKEAGLYRFSVGVNIRPQTGTFAAGTWATLGMTTTDEVQPQRDFGRTAAVELDLAAFRAGAASGASVDWAMYIDPAVMGGFALTNPVYFQVTMKRSSLPAIYVAGQLEVQRLGA